VANLQFVDAQMAQLTSQLAVYQTARNAYQAALQQLVPRAPISCCLLLTAYAYCLP
jgi:hypothetical protein